MIFILIDVKESNIKNISCVYIITNIYNNKVYIGQTTNLRKRISDYRNCDKRKNGVYEIIKREGIEKFKFEVLKFCNEDELTNVENYYINLYDSTNPIKGYNIIKNNNPLSNSVISRKLKSLSHSGLTESSDTKRKKSNPILIIKDNILIVSDSAKLFGDYIGKGKDIIKNSLRLPSSILGFLVYYDDYYKRQEIRKKMYRKRCIRNKLYMEKLDLLDKIEKEGLETIYEYFDEIFFINYDNINSEGKPILIKSGTF